MAAYLMVQMTVSDPAHYQVYSKAVVPLIEKHGARPASDVSCQRADCIAKLIPSVRIENVALCYRTGHHK
jgi:hypothetical protein